VADDPSSSCGYRKSNQTHLTPRRGPNTPQLRTGGLFGFAGKMEKSRET
jgi:hypothetical protein